jgi:dihydroorotate dehydrogenase (NAD+) catalytic subunit
MSDRLATRIGDLALVNPIICGSGEHVMTAAGLRAALASGAAGVISKSINETAAAAAQLDIADYALVAPDNRVVAWGGPEAASAGLLCRSGLQQIPVDDWLATVAAADREAARDGRFVAASIVFGGLDGALELTRRIPRAGIRVLEFNVGSPQATEVKPGVVTIESDAARLRAIVAAVRAEFPRTLWVKLPGIGGDIVPLARAAREGGAEAVGMVGRFVGLLPDVETLAPVLGTAAGFSGPWALPISCRWVAQARAALGPAFPVIGTNGARSGLDVARFLLAGATAVEMTSAVLQSGFGALGAARDELAAYMDRKALTAPGLVGQAADRMQGYAQQVARPGHWQGFVPRETLTP